MAKGQPLCHTNLCSTWENKKCGERFCDVRRILLFVGFFNLVDGPGGSEASGGVAADAHGDFAALAGLRVVQGEACAVSRGLDGTALAGDPVVLADNAEGIGAVGEIGRQLVQKRAGAEDLGCEIDGEVLGDGGRCGCGAGAAAGTGAGAGIWS